MLDAGNRTDVSAALIRHDIPYGRRGDVRTRPRSTLRRRPMPRA
jgi:hypothetical protein